MSRLCQIVELVGSMKQDEDRLIELRDLQREAYRLDRPEDEADIVTEMSHIQQRLIRTENYLDYLGQAD